MKQYEVTLKGIDYRKVSAETVREAIDTALKEILPNQWTMSEVGHTITITCKRIA